MDNQGLKDARKSFNPQPKPEKQVKKQPQPLKRTPIRPVAKKRAAQVRQYNKERLMYLEANKICQACGERPATEIHHMQGRENERLLDKSNWMAICRQCHRYATDNDRDAIEKGISKSKLI